MLRRAGGCTTTAFAMTTGLEADPAVSLRVELVQSWLQVVGSAAVPRPALDKAWAQRALELRGPRRWQRVRGPMGALIATLVDMNWEPPGPTHRTDPDGTEWEIDPVGGGILAQVAMHVRKFCVRELWRKAAAHHSGGGVGDDADLTAALRLRAAFKRKGDFQAVGLLDMIVQGAAWTPARRAEAGMTDGGACAFCDDGRPGTLRHQAWECPGVLAGIGEDREEARHFEVVALGPACDGAEAARQRWAEGVPPSECEAFWCRGILPRAGTGPLSALLVAPDHATEFGGSARAGVRLRLTRELGGHFVAGSDGSGGEHARDARLRRAGWGWAILRSHCGRRPSARVPADSAARRALRGRALAEPRLRGRGCCARGLH